MYFDAVQLMYLLVAYKVTLDGVQVAFGVLLIGTWCLCSLPVAEHKR